MPAIRRFRTDKHIVFSRISLLYVAKQACIACLPDAENLEQPEDMESMFSCCLIANDLVAERFPTERDSTMEWAASLLPLASYIPHETTYPRDLARNLLIFEEIAPQLRDVHGYRDLIAAFFKATGVLPEEFCELAFTASVRYLLKELPAGESFVLGKDYLQRENVPPDHIDAFFNKSSATTRDLQTFARHQESLDTDFLVFQRYPLVQVNAANYICLDPGFLLDKCGKSLYWTLHDAQQPDQRHQLLTYWCALIERYVHWLFAQTYQGRGTTIPSPQFANGDEAFDFAVLEGSRLVVIEVKASILTVQAKYGFSADLLGKELHRKAITGEDGERKGVAQLHQNLRRFLGGDDLSGINRGSVKMIYPVLVFLDRSFTSPYLHELYNEHFDRSALRGSPNRVITPLSALTLDDLENCLPYTNEHSMTEILDSYWLRNRNVSPEQRQFRVPILDDKKPGKDVARARLNRFSDDFQRAKASEPSVTSATGVCQE